jgi:hypothetical protein
LTGTLSGQVARATDGAAVVGANVAWQTHSATTGSLGEFELTGLPANAIDFLYITGSAIAPRQTAVLLTGRRSGLSMTAIPVDFLPFYRQFARNQHDAPTALRALRHWETHPSFYINTVLTDNGLSVPKPIVDDIVSGIARGVVELSGGNLRALTVETGTAPRGSVKGWVNVSFAQALPADNGIVVIGTGSVGSDPGHMEIRYDPAFDAANPSNPWNCRSVSVAVAEHELTHVMGFAHTDDTFGDFLSPDCTGAGRSGRARTAAAIVYARPVGNLDPDRDPNGVVMLQQGLAGSSADTVSCHASATPIPR